MNFVKEFNCREVVCTPEKLEAVWDYLRSTFPRVEAHVHSYGEPQAHDFRVRDSDGTPYALSLETAFIDGTMSSRIVAELRVRDVAEQMRENKKPLLLNSDGKLMVRDTGQPISRRD